MRLIRLFKKDLAREVFDWISDEIIEERQGRDILRRYGATLEDARRVSLGYYVLTAMAVLFSGLSLIVLVSANWDEIPRAVRLFGLIGLTAIVNCAGVYLFAKGRHWGSVLCLFFGSISYGVSIMLIAQIYHLGEHYPDGIFFWALGVLPLVLLLQSRILAFLMLALATIWMFVEANEGFFPAFFPIFALVCGWLVVRANPSTLLFVTTVAALVTWVNLLVAWIVGGGSSFDANEGQVPLTVGITLLLWGVAHWMMTKEHNLNDMGLVLSLWLLRGYIILLLVYSFSEPWEMFTKGHDSSILVFVATIPALGGAGVWFARRFGGIAVVPLVAFGVYYCTAICMAHFSQRDVPSAILTNLVLIGAGIWLIRKGVIEAVTHYYYTGIVVLLITAVFRYFDLIGDYVGAAILFMVAAGILFASAHFWKKRMHGEEVKK